jgi:hypothetical protein
LLQLIAEETKHFVILAIFCARFILYTVVQRGYLDLFP